MHFAEIDPKTLTIIDVYLDSPQYSNSNREDIVRVPDDVHYQCMEAYKDGENIRLRNKTDPDLLETLNTSAMKNLRSERNRLLMETDKYAIPDFPHVSDEIKQAWLDYRQALRNLPANTDDPKTPIWPISPS